MLRTPNLRNLTLQLWSPPTAVPQQVWILQRAGPATGIALWRTPPLHSRGHLALHCRPSPDGDMILTLEGNTFALKPVMDDLQIPCSDAGSGYVRRTHPLRLQDPKDLNLLYSVAAGVSRTYYELYVDNTLEGPHGSTLRSIFADGIETS